LQKRAFPLLDLPDLSSCRGAFAFPDALHSNPSFAGVRRCRRRGPIAAQITATDKARRESCTEARSGHPARLTICQILKSSPAIKKRACLVLARWGRRDPRGKNGARASSPSRPGPRRGDGRDAEGGGSRRVRPVQVMANIGERQGVQGSHLQGASTPRPNLSQLARAPEKAPESHPPQPPCKHHRYRSETGPSRSPSSRRLS
jgi:hypothetical protein